VVSNIVIIIYTTTHCSL